MFLSLKTLRRDEENKLFETSFVVNQGDALSLMLFAICLNNLGNTVYDSLQCFVVCQ